MKKKTNEILEHKIFTLEELEEEAKIWKANKNKLVFTNGCFDLLHIGHISYLAEAASLGNKLIVGLNSDASTNRLKGQGRPINNQHSRSMMLAAMFFIDAVVLFEE